MNFRRRFRLVLLAGLLALPVPAHALWSPEGESYVLDVGGSLRSIGAGMQNYDFPLLFGEDNEADGLSQTLLRITFTGELWNFYSYEAHVVQSFNFTTSAFSALGAVGGQGARRYRAFDFAWDWADSGDFVANLGFDRLNMKLSLPHIDITVGRQAINFSQTYFFSPLDEFLPFDPQAFDRDYKPGVDALRVDVALGEMSGLTLVVAVGRKISYTLSPSGTEPEMALAVTDFQSEPWDGTALMLRAFTNLWEWDFSVQGGKVYGGYQVGAGFSGELLTLGVSGEFVYHIAEGSHTIRVPDPREVDLFRSVDLMRDHASLAVGLNRRFENTLYLVLEYYYNGAGDADRLDDGLLRLGTGETTSLGEHLIGAMVSYELHPLLTAQLAWIFSFSDQSSLLSPSLAYSIADEAEFLLGAMLGFGARPSAQSYPVLGTEVPYPLLNSEFGTYPNIYFGEFKFYFFEMNEARPKLPGFGWALGAFFISTVLVLVLGSVTQALDVTLGLVFTELALILAPPLIIARLKGFDLGETFSFRRPAIPDLALALLAGFCGWVLAIQGTYWLTDTFGVDARTLTALHGIDPGLVGVMAVFPMCEEVLFRGFVFAGLRGRYKPIHAMLLTAFLFGIYHQDPTRHLAATFLGLVYGAALLRSGSILVPMAAHFANNLCAGLLSRTPWGIEALPLWQLLAAAMVLVGSVYLMGRNRPQPFFDAPPTPRRPVRFYVIAALMTLGTVVSLTVFYDLLIWQDVLARNGTVQVDRYRMRDNYWYRKESTIVLWGDGPSQWTNAGTTLSIPRGDGFISASVGGQELPYTLQPESRVALTLPAPPMPGTVVEVVSKGRFNPEGPFHFPSHPFVPVIALKATVDLREAPTLRFEDSGFRVMTPMFITYPKVGDWSDGGGYFVGKLLQR